MTETATHAYIGRKPCGCLTFAAIDKPSLAKEIAKEVAAAVKAGETVERIPAEMLQDRKWGCGQCRPVLGGEA